MLTYVLFAIIVPMILTMAVVIIDKFKLFPILPGLYESQIQKSYLFLQNDNKPFYVQNDQVFFCLWSHQMLAKTDASCRTRLHVFISTFPLQSLWHSILSSSWQLWFHSSRVSKKQPKVFKLQKQLNR
jgi:hypothetical protein